MTDASHAHHNSLTPLYSSARFSPPTHAFDDVVCFLGLRFGPLAKTLRSGFSRFYAAHATPIAFQGDFTSLLLRLTR